MILAVQTVVHNMFKLSRLSRAKPTGEHFWLQFSLFNIKAIAAILGSYDYPMLKIPIT